MPEFIRLTEYKNSNEKEKGFFDPKNRYIANQKDFSKIPGSPVAYWLSSNALNILDKTKPLSGYSDSRKGMCTRDNESFVRLWYEVAFNRIGFNNSSREMALSSDKKWFPYQKGGEFRQWAGNHLNIVDWENDGYKLLNMEQLGWKGGSTNHNLEYIFKPAIVWSKITSGKPNFRYSGSGFLFDDASGLCAVHHFKNFKPILAFLCSQVGQFYMKVINPTLNIQPGNMASLPILLPDFNMDVDRLINFSVLDWNSYENSWDFTYLHLLCSNFLRSSLKVTYFENRSKWMDMTLEMQKLEVAINKFFINAYGLQDELTPEVPLKEITLTCNPHYRYGGNKSEEELEELLLADTMKELISYSLGCFMGRYRLDKPGLQIAHPNPTSDEVAPYQYNGNTFEIDDDAIIPMMGSNCGFSDDIVYRVKSFIDQVWGEETLTENINFIEEALGKDLEKYLINDMWKYHVKMYKKKPIYWLFSSPKGAFQVVVYIHRMNRFTVQKIRNNYLLPHINYLSREIEILKNNEANLNKEESRRLTGLIKDEIECKEYEKLVKDFADRQIEFDLDDGVTVNHKKFEGIVEKIK